MEQLAVENEEEAKEDGVGLHQARAIAMGKVGKLVGLEAAWDRLLVRHSQSVLHDNIDLHVKCWYISHDC